MFAFCLIAMTKQGKSRRCREMITRPPLDQFGAFVNDVNNEYGQFRRDRETGEYKPSTNLSDNPKEYRARYSGVNMNMPEYLKLVKEKRYTTVIFEEATAFFKGRTSAELCQMVINKGHTNNNYIFCFHSVRSVPPELLGLMDWVVLFKTSDNEDIVKSKDPRLLPYWLDLQTKKDGADPWVINWLEAPPFNKQKYMAQKEKLGML